VSEEAGGNRIHWPTVSIIAALAGLIWTGGMRWSAIDTRLDELSRSCVQQAAFETRVGLVNARLNGFDYWVADLSKTVDATAMKQQDAIGLIENFKLRLSRLEANEGK
jgi:hypothetical protein